MARPHAKLRGAMMARDIDQKDLARKLLRGTDYVSRCMQGKHPWTLDEAYAIMALLRLPYDQLADYFPPKGA